MCRQHMKVAAEGQRRTDVLGQYLREGLRTRLGTEYLHEKIETRTGWITAAPDEDWVRGYPQEMQDFMEAIANGREPVSGLRLASDVIEVIYAAYQSAEEGRRISLELN